MENTNKEIQKKKGGRRLLENNYPSKKNNSSLFEKSFQLQIPEIRRKTLLDSNKVKV
jgi:hypothetical protein